MDFKVKYWTAELAKRTIEEHYKELEMAIGRAYQKNNAENWKALGGFYDHDSTIIAALPGGQTRWKGPEGAIEFWREALLGQRQIRLVKFDKFKVQTTRKMILVQSGRGFDVKVEKADYSAEITFGRGAVKSSESRLFYGAGLHAQDCTFDPPVHEYYNFG